MYGRGAERVRANVLEISGNETNCCELESLIARCGGLPALVFTDPQGCASIRASEYGEGR